MRLEGDGNRLTVFDENGLAGVESAMLVPDGAVIVLFGELAEEDALGVLLVGEFSGEECLGLDGGWGSVGENAIAEGTHFIY